MSIPLPQPTPQPTPTSDAVVPAQKPRAITANKSQTRHLQEEEEDDDEDDEEDDDDEVDDSHLVPSERHLHSFIGHWQVRKTRRVVTSCKLNEECNADGLSPSK